MKVFITALSLSLLLLGIPSTILANVAKVIILRGTVNLNIKGKISPVKQGDWINEGAIVETKDKSFAKLLFQDKSQVSVGPSSAMQISSFPKHEAGVLSLMKGQMRTQVTKNIFEAGADKSKLFVKTKTAAMGVRGTDFLVSFNPVNNATNTITYSGVVSMGNIDPKVPAPRNLERVVSSATAVSIRQGQFSSMNPTFVSRPTIATKLNPAQFNILQKNSDFSTGDKKSAKSSSAKTFRSLTPPGLSAKAVTVNASVPTVAIESTNDSQGGPAAQGPPPEGFVDKQTGAVAPAAGGFLDLEKGIYVAPPAGSVYDPNTETYVPPATMGKFDPRSGEYVNPPNYTINEVTGGFELNPQTTLAQNTPLPPPPENKVPGEPNCPNCAPEPPTGEPPLPPEPPEPPAPPPPPPPPVPVQLPYSKVLFRINVQ